MQFIARPHLWPNRCGNAAAITCIIIHGLWAYTRRHVLRLSLHPEFIDLQEAASWLYELTSDL